MADVSERRRVAIVDGAVRHDLSLPLHATLADALSSLGIRPRVGRDVLLDPVGREISALARIDEVADGAMLSFVDLSQRPTDRERRRAVETRALRGDATAAWWLTAGLALVLAIVSLTLPDVLAPVAHVTLGMLAAVAALLAGLFVAARARADTSRAGAALAAVLALAFAAGAAVIPALPAAGDVLSVFTGLLLTAVLAALLRLVAGPAGLRAALGTATVLLLILAAVWGLALLRGLPATAPAAVSVGLVPVALRALLATLVEVPPGLFIDYERYQTTRWSVRQQLPDEIHSIGAHDARRLVAGSTGRLLAGTVVLCAVAAVAAPFALPGFDGADPLVFAGRIALAATTVFALLLGARRFSAPLLRWMPRAAAAAVLIVVVLDVARLGESAILTAAAAGCLVAGAGIAFTVVPAARGAQSLFWSRLGDGLEWLAVALSLPAGLLAADAVGILRGMMAG